MPGFGSRKANKTWPLARYPNSWPGSWTAR